MREVVFCGFGELGRNSLEKLIESKYPVKFILTHKELREMSVDTYAINNNIPFSYDDARKNDNIIYDTIMKIQPYYLVSVNYHYIIPKNIFDIPKYAINIHGSLLPKYRGRTPHVWSIINGEKISGITSHIIEETVDAGDIIEQREVTIDENDTGYSLLKKYDSIYPSLLIDSLTSLENGLPLMKQNRDEASFYGKRTPDMGYIDFHRSSKDVINFIRAQANPYPGAYSYLLDGSKIIIHKALVDETVTFNASIGVFRIIEGSYYVKCVDAYLKLLDFKIES